MRILAAFVSLAVALSAQTAYPVGERDVAWPNTTGQGWPTLFTRIWYPATAQQQNAPVAPSLDGWPVVLFLHGFSFMGREYPLLCQEWARRGFVVVAPDTAIWNYVQLAQDAHANLVALAGVNVTPGDPLQGAIDMSRIAVAGHSMGGGTIAYVAAQNPGIRCAFAFAPAAPIGAAAAGVAIPFGCVVGDGDTITPTWLHAQPYVTGVSPQSPLKFLARLDGSSDHFTIIGHNGTTPDFTRAVGMSVGFFRHFLGIDADGLEQCIGPAVVADPMVVGFEQDTSEPRIWSSGAMVPGAVVRVSVAAESGDGLIFAGPAIQGGLATSIGTLLLDPSHAFTWIASLVPDSDRLDATLYVPNTPAVVGMTFAMQPAASTSLSTFRFGSCKQFVVGW